MKNLKRVIAFICVAAMILSMSVFAFEADDYALKLKASKTTVAPGETFTVTVYADGATSAKGFLYTYGNVEYNGSEFTFGEYITSNDAYSIDFEGAPQTDKDNSIIVEVDEKNAVYTDEQGGFVTFDVTVNEDLAAGDYTIELFDMYYESDAVESDYYSDILTITVESATAEIAKTITKGGKEYTSVPNKFFENVAVTGTTTGGTVTATYTGGTKTSQVFPFTFGGTILNGSGSVSFDVAIVGVPSNITVTDIAVSVN